MGQRAVLRLVAGAAAGNYRALGSQVITLEDLMAAIVNFRGVCHQDDLIHAVRVAEGLERVNEYWLAAKRQKHLVPPPAHACALSSAENHGDYTTPFAAPSPRRGRNLLPAGRQTVHRSLAL